MLIYLIMYFYDSYTIEILALEIGRDKIGFLCCRSRGWTPWVGGVAGVHHTLLFLHPLLLCRAMLALIKCLGGLREGKPSDFTHLLVDITCDKECHAANFSALQFLDLLTILLAGEIVCQRCGHRGIEDRSSGHWGWS